MSHRLYTVPSYDTCRNTRINLRSDTFVGTFSESTLDRITGKGQHWLSVRIQVQQCLPVSVCGVGISLLVGVLRML